SEGSNTEQVIKIARDYGFDFTPEEINDEIRKRQVEFNQRQEHGELTDEELEAVAGGEIVIITAMTAGGLTAILSFASVTAAAGKPMW
ncbi:MAG: Nif11-like leader peptide family natural product precursor, partial [Cyanobacteria bacterium J149]